MNTGTKQIKSDTIEITDITAKLMDDEKVNKEDYTKIIEVTKYLLEYFSENYEDLKLSKEVSEESEYIYTRGKNEGKIEGIKEGRNKEKIELAKKLT